MVGSFISKRVNDDYLFIMEQQLFFQHSTTCVQGLDSRDAHRHEKIKKNQTSIWRASLREVEVLRSFQTGQLAQKMLHMTISIIMEQA